MSKGQKLNKSKQTKLVLSIPSAIWDNHTPFLEMGAPTIESWRSFHFNLVNFTNFRLKYTSFYENKTLQLKCAENQIVATWKF